MSAFIFLAIEIASLAVRDTLRSASYDKHLTPMSLTVLPALLVVAAIVDIDDKRRIHDPRAQRLEQIQEEDPGGERRVLE